MKLAIIALPTIGLLALAASGCSQPTPAAEQPPGYFGTAGAPLVPPDDPNALGTIPATPKGTAAGGALVAPTQPYSTDQSTQPKQQNSGYFPNADAPLTPLNPSAR